MNPVKQPGKTTPHLTKLIVLMEDDDDIARLVTHHLESSGFRIHRPGRATNLISDAERKPPALFILDLMLPEMDGFEICRRIKAHPNLRDVPVLMLSARTGVEDRKQALESGAETYMAKPFTPSALIAAVRRLSNQNS